MPRNGSGVYSKPAGTTVVTGTTIESAKYNSVVDDLVTDANTVRPILAGGTGATTSALARGNLGVKAITCRLEYTSATALTLMPNDGNDMVIAGDIFEIPSSGVTLSNAGLTAATLYYVYVYVYNNAGQLAFDASTTGHSTDTTAGNVGVEIKTGDATRTLVGMVYLKDNGGTPEFKDENGYRLVASWFNRRSRPVRAERTSVSSSTSTSLVEISSAEFLTWGEPIKGGQNGSIYGVAGFQGVAAVYVDSVTDNTHIASSSTTFPSGSHLFDASSSGVTRVAVSEGHHEIRLYIASATTTYPVNHTKAMLTPFSSIFAEVTA